MNWTVITGGAVRLGAALCRHLAAKGYPLIIHYHTSEKEAFELVKECQEMGVAAECIQGNFSSQETTLQFIESFKIRFGSVQNLICNVGNYHLGSPLSTPLETWQFLFQINYFSQLSFIQHCAPLIQKTQGSIITMGVVGIQNVVANLHRTAYNQTKLALWMLTKSLAKELAKDHVRVNMISPGFLSNSIDAPKNELPMGRYAQLEEVCEIVSFLLDPKQAYITGQNIEVAGGYGL